MTDPADRFLEERLHALARGVRVPLVPAEEDVRRGRRRLFRMRVAMAGASTAALAVVVGITGLTAGDPKATAPPITHTPSILPATPSSTPSDDSSDATEEAPSGQSGRTQVVGDPPAADPSSQHTGDPDSPAKHGPTRAATGGTTTPGGVITRPDDQPGGTQSSDPTEAPSSTVTSTTTPTDEPTSTPTETPTTIPTVPPTQTTKVRVHRVLGYYNDVLAEHLDPDRIHLQPYDRDVDPKQTTTANGKLYALGSTYRWEDGRSLSGLEVTVASGWDQVDWLCGASYADWDCHLAATTETAEVATHDGVRQVAVEHAGGQVVVVTADPTHDSHARSAADVASTEADLVAAASDNRLILPGIAPVAPPTIDLNAFAAAGVAALVKPHEGFQQTGISRTPWVRGGWSAGNEKGTLTWTVQPTYSRGSFTCLTTFRSCSEVTIDDLGTTVHLAFLKKRAGGGWLVQYDGGAYGVRVYSSDRTFPKKRAYAFVTQPAWQPGR
jgi:hypothetical protein